MNNRRKLPNERDALTHRFTVGGGEERNKGYVTVGLYEDGTPGELFVKLDQQGSQASGFVDAWAIAVSMLLQTGTSLQTICDKFRGMSFLPSGMTGNTQIPIAKSPIDYIVRWLEGRFIDSELHAEALPPDKVCNRCGSTENVHLHNGSQQCAKCRSGKMR